MVTRQNANVINVSDIKKKKRTTEVSGTGEGPVGKGGTNILQTGRCDFLFIIMQSEGNLGQYYL